MVRKNLRHKVYYGYAQNKIDLAVGITVYTGADPPLSLYSPPTISGQTTWLKLRKDWRMLLSEDLKVIDQAPAYWLVNQHALQALVELSPAAPRTWSVALNGLRLDYPHLYTLITGVHVLPNRATSPAAHKQRFLDRHRREYIELESSLMPDTDPHYPGFMYVRAGLGGEERDVTAFFVKLADYQRLRTEYGMVCSPAMYDHASEED